MIHKPWALDFRLRLTKAVSHCGIGLSTLLTGTLYQLISPHTAASMLQSTCEKSARHSMFLGIHCQLVPACCSTSLTFCSEQRRTVRLQIPLCSEGDPIFVFMGSTFSQMPPGGCWYTQQLPG